MHIAVVGAGAVGGFYAARLARSGERVSVIARGAHLRAIHERGLLIWSPLGDHVVRLEAESDPARVGPVDLVILAVKTYANAQILPLLPWLCGPETAVLTLQNSVASADALADAVGEERVLAGTTYVATAIVAPGLIEQTGVHRRVILGEAFGERRDVSARAARIADVLARADVHAEAVADGRVPVWEKLVYLATFAAFTGVSRRPAGAIWGDPIGREAFLAVAAEVEAVALAEGVPIAGDVIARMVGYLDALPPDTRSSLLIDLQQGKQTEVEALQGEVVRRGRELGVPTPGMTALYAALRAGGA
ncbi:MAG: 2-dehydropantoate 2-reductase [Vicinamibacteraceae bacterium]